MDGFPPISAPSSFSPSRDIQPGTPVLAIGHPEQGALWTLTSGVIGARINDFGGVKRKAVFQMDASINRGNSGGPLLDQQERVVGINTAMARKAPDGMAITSVNFALRSDVVLRWLEQIGQARPSFFFATSGPWIAVHKSSEENLSGNSPGNRSSVVNSPQEHPVWPYREESALRQEGDSLQRMGNAMEGTIHQAFDSP